jgi:membrane protein DedA with SNARE-associated domain
VEQTIAEWLSTYGAPALFALLAFGVVGLPLPDEALLALAGALIGHGRLHPVAAAAAAMAGAMTGITLSYGLGRFAGLPLLLRYGSRLHVDTAVVTRVGAWFDRAGKWLLLVGYFIPGIRHVTAIVAGASKLPVATFMAFAYAGAVLWVFCFLAIGYLLGDEWRGLVITLHRHLLAGGLILAALVGGYAYFSARRRRSR